jgi:hypothetical protein
LVWDLCNEPNAFDTNVPWANREFAFFTEVAAAVRACGVRQPITFGTMFGSNIEIYAPLCDVLCGHAYTLTLDELKGQIEGFLAISKKAGKVMLVNEVIVHAPGAFVWVN